ncbi:MAG TPA: DUF2232 domain-containing protein [Woeseiaceae bacterium]|nr:DUF2232 domain-containing protein [Woeseiaceae bacterium]
MQAMATWLVARPLHSILALAATISLAWFSFLSAVVLILLLLQKGVQTAAVYAVIAGALVTLVGLVVGLSPANVISQALPIWLPALLLGAILRVTRSLTLTLQLSFIIAIAGMLVFFVLVEDATLYWRQLLDQVITVWREAGLHEQADILTAEKNVLAGQMTMIMTLTLWSVHVVSCVLGYKLYRQLPGRNADFGLFRNLNFGRVIAWAMALVSIGAFVSGAGWVQNTAFIMFAMFWLQGLAIVHWSHAEGFLPTFALVATYVLAPVLNVVLIMGLAITGYVDAWFGIRRLKTA